MACGFTMAVGCLWALGCADGQPIDSEDPRWLLFVALERKPRRTAAGAEPGAGAGSGEEEWGEVAVAGICTVYRFFHYPASERLRVSQVSAASELVDDFTSVSHSAKTVLLLVQCMAVP